MFHQVWYLNYSLTNQPAKTELDPYGAHFTAANLLHLADHMARAEGTTAPYHTAVAAAAANTAAAIP